MFDFASKPIESKTKDLVEKTTLVIIQLGYAYYKQNVSLQTNRVCSTWNKCYLPRKTNSTLMSLGVTPLIRDAWDIVTGFMAVIFSRAS